MLTEASDYTDQRIATSPMKRTPLPLGSLRRALFNLGIPALFIVLKGKSRDFFITTKTPAPRHRPKAQIQFRKPFDYARLAFHNFPNEDCVSPSFLLHFHPPSCIAALMDRLIPHTTGSSVENREPPPQ
ncbi:hypothetical protein Trydic_g5665 [Trypoxylus dichotomus]